MGTYIVFSYFIFCVSLGVSPLHRIDEYQEPWTTGRGVNTCFTLVGSDHSRRRISKRSPFFNRQQHHHSNDRTQRAARTAVTALDKSISLAKIWNLRLQRVDRDAQDQQVGNKGTADSPERTTHVSDVGSEKSNASSAMNHPA